MFGQFVLRSKTRMKTTSQALRSNTMLMCSQGTRTLFIVQIRKLDD